MLSLIDIKGMCECTEDEIEAIADHECVPEVIASELGAYLLHSPDGIPKIRCFIRDDIELAEREGNMQQVEKLNLVLSSFSANHPEYPVGHSV